MRTPAEKMAAELQTTIDQVALIGLYADNARRNTVKAVPTAKRTVRRGARKLWVLGANTVSAVGAVGIGFTVTLGEHVAVAGAMERFLWLMAVLVWYTWRTRVAWQQISPPHPRPVRAKAQSVPAPAPEVSVLLHTDGLPATARTQGQQHRAVRRARKESRLEAEARIIAEVAAMG